MDLEAFLKDLYFRRARGVKLGLETTRELVRLLGRPDVHPGIVHVAGTNGKGSVTAMAGSIFRAAGKRTAVFTSPHLVRFNERFAVDGDPIPDAELLEILKEVDRAAIEVAAHPGLRHPTFFEFTTAAALLWFSRMDVDAMVLETGLGGRLDATNVVQPALSAITSIAVDHVSFLGSTIEAIAREKAGIIKPGVPVVMGAMDPAARSVVMEAAESREAPAIEANEWVTVRLLDRDLGGQRIEMETPEGVYGPLTLPLLGDHQLENAATAVAAVETWAQRKGLPLPKTAVVQGLESVSWPGRAQVLSRDPVVVLDAAHNPAGFASLFCTLEAICPGRPVGLVAAFSKEKDVEAILQCAGGAVSASWLTELDNPAALPVEVAARAGRAAGLNPVCLERDEAIREAVAWAARRGGVVCIAGSVYLAGEVLAAQEDRHPMCPYP
jgi:dihydrofolate synthase/folylpolyglutamate synthase